MIQMNSATGLPWRFPSAYTTDANVQRAVISLAEAGITDERIEWVAVLAHKATPWAGRPVPWPELTEQHREDLREFAQWAMEHPR